MVQVFVHNRQRVVPINARSFASAVKCVLDLENVLCDEVGIHLVGIKEICKLHAIYFQDPTPTDCISFPIDSTTSPIKALGDLFICPKVASDYAEKHHLDLYQEITLYLVHGLLHLIGYDDIKETDRACMRRAERKHMRNLIAKQLLIS